MNHMKHALPSTDITPATLADSERQPCEIWTRVMGYHRPVSSFNVGKKGEQAERLAFRETVAFGEQAGVHGLTHDAACDGALSEAVGA